MDRLRAGAGLAVLCLLASLPPATSASSSGRGQHCRFFPQACAHSAADPLLEALQQARQALEPGRNGRIHEVRTLTEIAAMVRSGRRDTESKEFLLAALGSPSGLVRWEAAVGLRGDDEPRVVQALKESLTLHCRDYLAHRTNLPKEAAEHLIRLGLPKHELQALSPACPADWYRGTLVAR